MSVNTEYSSSDRGDAEEGSENEEMAGEIPPEFINRMREFKKTVDSQINQQGLKNIVHIVKSTDV